MRETKLPAAKSKSKCPFQSNSSVNGETGKLNSLDGCHKKRAYRAYNNEAKIYRCSDHKANWHVEKIINNSFVCYNLNSSLLNTN